MIVPHSPVPPLSVIEFQFGENPQISGGFLHTIKTSKLISWLPPSKRASQEEPGNHESEHRHNVFSPAARVHRLLLVGSRRRAAEDALLGKRAAPSASFAESTTVADGTGVRQAGHVARQCVRVAEGHVRSGRGPGELARGPADPGRAVGPGGPGLPRSAVADRNGNGAARRAVERVRPGVGRRPGGLLPGTRERAAGTGPQNAGIRGTNRGPAGDGCETRYARAAFAAGREAGDAG